MRVTEHILVDIELKEYLKNKKQDENESFNSVLRRLLKVDKNLKGGSD